jgi:serine/threonine-protein kinase
MSYILQACEAVAEAHKLGIVHRDLKLANLFRTIGPDDQPCIKVLDFGISKLLDKGAISPSISLTSNDTILGSPLYMSPEQLIAPRTVDERTDIWSIGVILYELLTGTSPFHGANITEICANVATRDPRPASELRPEIPQWLDVAILRCLAKDRAQRFAELAELASALLPFADACAIASLEKIIRMRHPVETPAIDQSNAQRPLDSIQGSTDTPITLSRFISRRLPAIAVGFATTLALLGGTTGYFIVATWSPGLPSAQALRHRSPSRAAETPSASVVFQQEPEHVASGHKDLKYRAPETPSVSDAMPFTNNLDTSPPNTLPLRSTAKSRRVPAFTTLNNRTPAIEKSANGTSTNPFVTIQERWKGRL